MPYRPLAVGHLTRPTWATNTLRSATDNVSHGKYDRAEDNDLATIGRVQKVAEQHSVPVVRVAIAWQWTKGVASPIIGATKARYLDDAAVALDLELAPDEIASMEEPHLPHETVGAIDSNPPEGVVLLNAEENRLCQLPRVRAFFGRRFKANFPCPVETRRTAEPATSGHSRGGRSAEGSPASTVGCFSGKYEQPNHSLAQMFTLRSTRHRPSAPA